MTRVAATRSIGGGRLQGLLGHERLSVRFAALGALTAATLLVAWMVSYLVLPEGVLRGRTAAAVLAGTEAASSFWAEWARIVAINLVMGAVPVLANTTFAYRGYPLGYLPPLLWAALYGVTLGTNSFSLPLSAPMAPSLAVLGRAGVYELAAYALVAATTATLVSVNITSFVPQASTLLRPRPPFQLTQWAGLAVAVVLVLAAGAWEAVGILNYAGTP